MLFFKKFVDMHVKLSDYKMDLMREAEKEGSPFTRSLMLHFPDDARARRENSEFMLGENILVAPVFLKGASARDVYLPGPAEWTHVWSGKTYSVGAKGLSMLDFPAPIGEPAVFTRDTEKVKMSNILREYYGPEMAVFDQ